MRILRIDEVLERTGLSRSTLWRLEKKQGDFPSRRKLGSGSVGWIEEEIDEWIRSRDKVNDREER
jgi:prophage regulatory protein